MRKATIGALVIVAIVAIALTVINLVGGGSQFEIARLRVSSRNPARPFFVACLVTALLLVLKPTLARNAASVSAGLPSLDRLFPWLTVWLAGTSLILSIIYGSFVAAAADSYGYVSQAELLSAGSLRIIAPLAADVPWPDALWTLSPHGYRPSFDGTSIVPTYPPGLPLLMALFLELGGRTALYLVVPVAAAVGVGVTALLGRRIAGPAVGIMAGGLLMASPTFLFHSFVPMSDVPVTAAWVTALFFALGSAGGTTATPILIAGLCSGLAVLIRPNLAPLLLVLVVIASTAYARFADASSRHARGRRLITGATLYGIGLLPGLTALASLNTLWYGSPLASGYGDLTAGFSLAFVRDNLLTYPRWLTQTQTWFIWLAFVAPLVSWRVNANGRAAWRGPELALVIFALAVFAGYAFYIPFDEWVYLRFLLPALPVLLVLAVLTLVTLTRRLARPMRELVLITIFGTVLLTTWNEAVIRGAFSNAQSVKRFEDVPRFLASSLPENAIYLARVYSGSVRYYSDRATLRWDLLPEEWLDRALAHLRTLGLSPYIIVEARDEERLFRERFGGQGVIGRLDWPPAVEYVGVETVRIYDPDDRERHLAGQSIATQKVGPEKN